MSREHQPSVVRLFAVFSFAALLQAAPATAAGPSTEAVEPIEAAEVAALSPRDLRTIIREGTVPAERQGAFDTLEAMASSGNATAALYLGDLYRSGTFVATDLALAADAYLIAIGKQNATAARTLADMILRGDAAQLTTEQALSYYELAGSKGDGRALQKLGDLYRDGKHVAAADPARAAQYYQLAIEAGQAAAALRLGDLYRNGLDPSLSFAIYQAAADAGDTAAMLRLGDAYRDNIAGMGDPAKAVGYYQAALDAGADNAFSRMVNLQLSTPDLAPSGIATLEAAIASGRPNASVMLANAYLNGQGVAVDVPAALGILRTATEAGDLPAARRLIRLYVDGKGRDLPRDPAAARAVLAQVADRLDPEALFRDTLAVDAAMAADPSAFASIIERFDLLDGAARSSLAGQMGNANPNAYVLMLQSHLQEEGLYSGALSGMLTQGTISAFNAFCAAQDVTSACLGGPLSSPARRVFRDALEAEG